MCRPALCCRRKRLIQLLLSCGEEKPAAVITSVSDHFHLEHTRFYHTLLLSPRRLRFHHGNFPMFSLNCHCLSRLSRVQDCRNGISMELFLHLSLLPAVSASVLRSQPLEIDNPPLDPHTCAVCIYSCLLVLPGFHHSGSLIPPEESQQAGIRQQTAIPGRSIRCCGVRSPHKCVPWNHTVELIPHIWSLPQAFRYNEQPEQPLVLRLCLWRRVLHRPAALLRVLPALPGPTLGQRYACIVGSGVGSALMLSGLHFFQPSFTWLGL